MRNEELIGVLALLALVATGFLWVLAPGCTQDEPLAMTMIQEAGE